MDVLRWPPWWYCALAVLVGAYHVWRGWALQWDFGANTADRDSRATRFRLLRCLADAILYGVCSVVGFGSLYAAERVLASIERLKDISGTAAATVGALAVVGVLGVTCQLPHLIQGGKILPK